MGDTCTTGIYECAGQEIPVLEFPDAHDWDFQWYTFAISEPARMNFPEYHECNFRSYNNGFRTTVNYYNVRYYGESSKVLVPVLQYKYRYKYVLRTVSLYRQPCNFNYYLIYQQIHHQERQNRKGDDDDGDGEDAADDTGGVDRNSCTNLHCLPENVALNAPKTTTATTAIGRRIYQRRTIPVSIKK